LHRLDQSSVYFKSKKIFSRRHISYLYFKLWWLDFNVLNHHQSDPDGVVTGFDEGLWVELIETDLKV